MFHLKNVLYSLNIILWGFVTFARIYDCFISNPIPIEAVKPSDWCVIIGGPIIIILFIVSMIGEKRKNKKIKEYVYRIIFPSMKITDDFKKGAKGLVFYAIAAIVVFPIFHLIKGDFDWGDTLINAGLMVVICLVLAVFFYFGMQVPKKNDDSAKE